MSKSREIVQAEMKNVANMKAGDAVAHIVKATGLNENTVKQLYFAIKRDMKQAQATAAPPPKSPQLDALTQMAVLQEAQNHGGLKALKTAYEQKLAVLENLIKLAA